MRLLFICLLLYIFSTSLTAQQYNFAHYSLEAGLAQSEVFDIVQDRRGNIWVANNGGGISRFDGKKFVNFDERDGLIHNVTRAILEDSKGNLWIATPQGISKYDGNKFTNFNQQLGFRSGFFLYTILEDKKGKIIISPFTNINANSSTLYVIDNEKFTTFNRLSNILDNKAILSIIKDKQGNILINTNTGTYIYDGEKIELHAVHQIGSFQNTGIFALLHDSQNRLWFVHNNQLKYFKEQQVHIFTFPTHLPHPNTILEMIEDQKGNLWLRYGNTGVVRYDGHQFTHFTNSNGLSGNEIRALYEDREGNIWLGGNGFLRFQGERFTYYNTQSGLTSNLAMTTFQDSKNRIWIGTGAGISMIDKGKISNYFEKNAETIGRVKSFVEDSQGNILVATRNGGILRFDGQEFKNINQELGINFNSFSHLYQDNNTLWIGSWGNGAYKIDKNKVTHFVPNQLPNPAIFHIFKDSKSQFWISTSAGIAISDGEKITKIFQASDGLNNEIIMQFAEDKFGKIWIATFNGGVNIYDGEKFASLRQENGLASNTTYFVMIDKQENIWVGTQKGVDKITLDDKGAIKNIKNYAKEEGFGGIECNGNACYEDQNGHLWFGTINGLYKYNPKEDVLNSSPPKVHFTKLKLFFQDLDWADSLYTQYHQGVESWFPLPKQLTLPYDQNHLTFEFEALDYQSPNKVKYQWKLEGADKDWLPITNRQEATYANLQPNNYRFLLRASNGDEIWTEEPTTFAFTIKPPFWQTWWFRTGILSLVVGLTFTGVRIRLKSLELQKLELERQVQERTSEVVKKSNELLLKNVELEQQKEEILSQNEQINQQHKQLGVAFEEIDQKNKDITASITYAKRIQQAILPLSERISKVLPEHFILFKPRDIVSGDFYWFSELHDEDSSNIVLAAIDCTGHGVPGAFMSLIGNELLMEIVERRKILQANEILNELHKGVRKALKQEETENRDGMDMTICIIDKTKRQMQFAGAKNPIVYIQNGTLEFIKGDRKGIGGYQAESERNYTNYSIDLSLPTIFYLFTDGYQDQFGGEQKRQFSFKKFKDLLLSIHHLPIEAQKESLETQFHTWKGNTKQIDDILVIGVKI
jgi:ligand-binding sensor domain-containing protein/serine phosphatase RsbU (regulator of sigma subunit)